MSELLIPLDEAALVVPPMQKLFVTGNILPGTDLSPQRLEHFVAGLSEVTGMNLFGAVQIKTPDHYDEQTFSDLGRPPEDINVCWMWDDSGGQLYTFPSRAFWTTIDLHTCKQFDSQEALNYMAQILNFRENMHYSEQDHSSNSDWQAYNLSGLLPEVPFISDLAEILDTDSSDLDRASSAGKRLEEIVYQSVSEGWGNRLAALFSDEKRAKIRELHGSYEIGVDDSFMEDVLASRSVDSSDYPFQEVYDRLAIMEAEAVNLSPAARILHIGTGWPGTAIGLYNQNGNPVTCVEIDPNVALKSKRALEQLGLYGEGKITVVNMDGSELNPQGYGAVIISAMVPTEDKLRILTNVNNTSIEAGQIPIILRQPADHARSLFYQPLPHSLGVRAVNQTAPGPKDPLQSKVVLVGRAPGIGAGRDDYLIRAERSLSKPVPV